MSEKLATKPNSSRPSKFAIFCIVNCSFFLLYWIILIPLAIDHPPNSTKTDLKWFIIYWCLAFFVWLFIMVCTIIIWRRLDAKHDEQVKLQSYGTNDSPKSASVINTKFNDSQSTKLKDTKPNDKHLKDSDTSKLVHETKGRSVSKESQDKIKRHKDLPPLVIHRRNFGNDIEAGADTVNVHKNDDEDVRKSGMDSQKDQRESMKSYLKLVTVSPQDETDTKTPKALLSPRELFFIDLIKEAEKSERNRGSGNSAVAERKHFFPNDFVSTERDIVTRDLNERKGSSEISTSNKGEATYFIADVGSPKSEKAEVFLEIKPDTESTKRWTVDLNNEEQTLTIQDNVKNEDRVVLFEV